MGFQVSNDKLSGLPNHHRYIGIVIESDKDDSVLNQFLLGYHRLGKRNFVEEQTALKKALGVPVLPQVEIKIESDIGLINDSKKNKKLRAVFVNSSFPISLVKDKVSHLLEGIETDSVSEPTYGRIKICPQIEDFDVLVEFTSEQDVRNIIVDIAYDILMFYNAHFNIKYNDINKKRLFSSLKVDYAKKIKLIPEKLDIKYISFSTLARDKDGEVDFPKFIGLWSDFEKFVDSYSEYDRPSLTNEDLACDIIKTHPQGGQISYKALLKMLNAAKGEKLVLIRTLHAPRTKKEKSKLFGALGIKKWRCGIMRIRPFEEQYFWIRHQRYVSVFIVER